MSDKYAFIQGSHVFEEELDFWILKEIYVPPIRVRVRVRVRVRLDFWILKEI